MMRCDETSRWLTQRLLGHGAVQAVDQWLRRARHWAVVGSIITAVAGSPGAALAVTTVAVDAGVAGVPPVLATGFTGSEWSVIHFTDTMGNFVERGYLDLSAYVVAGSAVPPSGHSLYASFDVNTTGLSTATIYSALGDASFGFDAVTGAAKVALEAGVTPTVLATGIFSAMTPTNSATGLGFTALLTFTQLSGLSIDLAPGHALVMQIDADHPFQSTTPFSEVTALTAPVGEGGASVTVGYRIVGGRDTLNFAVAAVPEPSAWAQLLLGGLLIGAVWQRRRFSEGS
ncbi:PEP-CTERM sorting domain-containing protein [Roseateles sp. BYS96W]|uniref:PEP-CTERM sorting domain-containing protein n=1 Tax=Pelomonas nitida TaxID=3299027 RepID=A0ABW7GCA9_9BURK